MFFSRNLEGLQMRLSYKKLWVLLVQRDMTKADLRKEIDISSSTLTKMNRNEVVSLSVLLKICDLLKCDIGDIMEVQHCEDENNQ